jgi:hypothetical protein
MRNRLKLRRPATLASMALVITLASLGFGYAAWNEQLSINGTVETANMGVKWILPTTTPTLCGDNDDLTMMNSGSTQVYRDPGDPKLLHLQVSNGYPGYKVTCGGLTFQVDADSIPVEASEIRIEGTPVANLAITPFNLDGVGDDDVEIQFIDGLGDPYPPGDGNSDTIVLEVLPGAPPGVTLEFTAEIIFVPSIP